MPDEPIPDEPIPDEPIPDEDWQPDRLEELFAGALDRPPRERTEWLAAECAGSPGLREAVDSLLAAHAEGDGALDRLDAGRAADLLAAVHPGPGAEPRRIGPFRLVREIGRGGMGVVYLAERAEGGFEQRVALKLVAAGPGGRQMPGGREILERFRRERQILAGLEHPGIARLIDGGVSAEGQPWFAMELVAGEPITRYAERRSLPLGGRLELFLQVCDAVQRAHAALVVHRDLKPSNVLVDEDGRVKLVDFGIAKVLAPQGDGSADAATRIGLRALTPEYASPEQIRGEPVTTESDVYALGVVLYELIAGRLPYDGPLDSPAEVVRAVCETTPRPPSRITRPGVGRPSGPPAAPPDRDLDAVCLKALEKERDRRYGSVEALAEDVRRYLSDLPVVARPPSTLYRARKFVRRHRWGVAAAAAAVLALVIGLAGTAWQAKVAAAQRDRAAAEATKAIEIQRFLTSLLQSVDPWQTDGAPWTAEQLLDLGSERVDGLLPEQPEVAADVLAVLGEVSQSLGQFERAEELWRRALALRRQHPGPHRVDLAGALVGVGRALDEQSRDDEAQALADEALAIGRRAARLDPEAAEIELAPILELLGDLEMDRTRPSEAEQRYREALGLRRRRLPDDELSIAEALTNLGVLARNRQDYDEAAARFREVLGILDASVGEDHPMTSQTLNLLATTLARQGAYREAARYYRQALAIARRAWGERHPRIPAQLSNLALVLLPVGEFEESAALLGEALELDRELLGEDHPYFAYSLDNLGRALTELGRLDEAKALFEQAYPILVDGLGPDSRPVASHLYGYAIALRLGGEPERALDHLQRATAILAAFPDAVEHRAVEVMEETAACLVALGRGEQAETVYRQALERQPDRVENVLTVELLTGLGRVLTASGRWAEAEVHLADAVRLAEAMLPPSSPYRQDAELALAAALAAEGRTAGAGQIATAVQQQLVDRSDVHSARLLREAERLAGSASP